METITPKIGGVAPWVEPFRSHLNLVPWCPHSTASARYAVHACCNSIFLSTKILTQLRQPYRPFAKKIT